MTFTSARVSSGAGLATLAAVFDSVFLLVTFAFGFSGAGFAASRDEGFAVDGAAVFRAVVATVFGAALPASCVGALALLAGAAAVFFTAGFAIDLAEAGLVADGAAFFAATVGFADFFIAFAMESIPKDCSRAPSELRFS